MNKKQNATPPKSSKPAKVAGVKSSKAAKAAAPGASKAEKPARVSGPRSSMTHLTVKHYNIADTGGLSNPCFQPSDRSVSITVENRSPVSISNPTVAFYSFQDDFWRNPIRVASRVASGRTVVKTITDENVRIVEMKLKFEAETKVFRSEESAAYPWYIKCIILTVNHDMSYEVGIVWSSILD